MAAHEREAMYGSDFLGSLAVLLRLQEQPKEAWLFL